MEPCRGIIECSRNLRWIFLNWKWALVKYKKSVLETLVCLNESHSQISFSLHVTHNYSEPYFIMNFYCNLTFLRNYYLLFFSIGKCKIYEPNRTVIFFIGLNFFQEIV